MIPCPTSVLFVLFHDTRFPFLVLFPLHKLTTFGDRQSLAVLTPNCVCQYSATTVRPSPEHRLVQRSRTLAITSYATVP